jgi:hypothetical protein
MRRTILSLCVLSVLAWAGGAQAQGKGKGKAGEVAKADANAPAAEKKATTPQEGEKGAKEKGKALRERVQQQAQAQGKGAKGGAEEQIAQMKAKGRDMQAKAFEKQAQRDTGKHMERLAKLQRIRELFDQKGDKETVARVDKLIAKENEVYNRKLQRTKGGPGAAVSPAGASQGGGEVKGPEKAEAPKPAETKPEGQAAPPAQEKPAETATPAPAAPANKPAEPQQQPKQQ